MIALKTASFEAPPGSGHLEVPLTANMGSNWCYLRLNDPGAGRYRLTAVRRANGTYLPVENFWQSDRTFIAGGRRPLYEHKLHLLDYNASGPYSLIYAPEAALDVFAPTSTVSALPSGSYAQIPVQWSGADESGGSGLAFFDVLVSVNGGPFTPWLERTTVRGAIYNGSMGDLCAFYSIATDQSGNREAAPATPDAETTVSLVNTPPSLTPGSEIVINEGDTAIIDHLASDADVPANTLTFTLGTGAPPGAVIGRTTGRITWATGEGNGPSTNLLNVIVTDNGLPSLSTNATVRVVVNEVNTAPVLATLTNRTVNEGALVSFTAAASDVDLPANALSFSLGAGTPSGVAINASNGVFTWRPSEFQGPSTNRIAVVATDNGVPPMSATQFINIIVRDSLADFALSLGSTNLLAGQTNSVPIVLNASADLTNVSFFIETASDRLTNLVLEAVTPEVLGSLLRASGSNQVELALDLNASLLPPPSRELARLRFASVSNEHSAIVPLTVRTLTGTRADGTLLPRGAGYSGRVIVVAREPVLASRLSPQRVVTLYGRPGAIYAVDCTTNLNGGWQELLRVPLTGLFTEIAGLDVTAGAVFYRAREFQADPPQLTLSAGTDADAQWPLLLYGVPGVSYELLTATNLPPTWLPLTNLTLTNSFQTLGVTNRGDAMRLFRARRP